MVRKKNTLDGTKKGAREKNPKSTSHVRCYRTSCGTSWKTIGGQTSHLQSKKAPSEGIAQRLLAKSVTLEAHEPNNCIGARKTAGVTVQVGIGRGLGRWRSAGLHISIGSGLQSPSFEKQCPGRKSTSSRQRAIGRQSMASNFTFPEDVLGLGPFADKRLEPT